MLGRGGADSGTVSSKGSGILWGFQRFLPLRVLGWAGMNAKTFLHIFGVGVASLLFMSLLVVTSSSLRFNTWGFGFIMGIMFFAFVNYIVTKTGRGWEDEG